MTARPGPGSDATRFPPFETDDLRRGLAVYLDQEVGDPVTGGRRRLGNFRWGVYAFFDYDGEPIYVGQTNEMLRTRIRRHLTNQRTDAVAMSVLDPFEVFEIEAWPMADLQDADGREAAARERLNALERQVHATALAASRFGAVLNEKDPPPGDLTVETPASHRGRIVSEAVYRIRSHPDVRMARRAQVIARLAQVVSERKVQAGLRRVLLVQAQRLAWLAERRSAALEGARPEGLFDHED